MAADDGGERTEQATPRRRQEAREQGRIARSNDLTAAVGLLLSLVLLRSFGQGIFDGLLDLVARIGHADNTSAEDLAPWVLAFCGATLRMTLPFLILLMVLTAVGAGLQTGMLVTWKRLQPDLSKLSPMKGLHRIFSGESLTMLGLALLKLAVVGTVACTTITGQMDRLLTAGALTPRGVLFAGIEVVDLLALRLGVILLIIGLLDYFYQRWKLERSLKMTKQEVRDEMKRMDGDPLIKRRQREVQVRVAMQRLHVDVPRADVVVTNPTHVAVALRYDEGTMAAPRVIAKGRELVAERIRQIALQHRIPIVQRPPLARALFAAVEVGQEVPPNFYRAVAEVLAYVYQLSGRTKAVG